jgi:hypothetical protein
MKNFVVKSGLVALSILFPLLANTQIPNADFEQWSEISNMMIPDGWAFMAVEGVAVPVTRTVNSHSGTYAAYGEVLDAGLLPPFSLISPTLVSVPAGSEVLGFSVSEKYTVLSGFYKFSPVEGDKFVANVTMYHDTVAIGIGALMEGSIASTYTPFLIPISYMSEETPNICVITFTICGPTGSSDYHEGSSYIVDNLSFDSPISVYERYNEFNNQFVLNQNYPNPFRFDTEIHFQIPSAMNVNIKIFNILGQEIYELADRKFNKGQHMLRWNGRDYSGNKVSKGMYFYRLQSGDLSQAKKMYLLR